MVKDDIVYSKMKASYLSNQVMTIHIHFNSLKMKLYVITVVYLHFKRVPKLRQVDRRLMKQNKT